MLPHANENHVAYIVTVTFKRKKVPKFKTFRVQHVCLRATTFETRTSTLMSLFQKFPDKNYSKVIRIVYKSDELTFKNLS